MRNVTPAVAALLAAALLAGPSILAGVGGQAWGQGRAQQETRQVPSLREAVFNGVSRANDFADEDDYASAHREIDRLRRLSTLNAYERAYIAQMQAVLYTQEERYAPAIAAYEDILALHEDIPRGMLESALWALVQLTLFDERYEQTLEYGERWLQLAENPGGDPYYRLAYAHFHLGQFAATTRRARQALDASAAPDHADERESYYTLLRAAYYELDDQHALRDVLEALVSRWPRKEYWIHLSSVYAELGLDALQLAVLELLYEDGQLDRESELIALASLYIASGGAYKGARVLERGLSDGFIRETYESYRRLSQAWVQAQDDRRAVAPLQEAARLAPNGELYVELAHSHFNLYAYQDCVAAARSALARGGLEREDRAHLVLGHCLMEQEAYDEAVEQFLLAAQDVRSRAGAETMIRWIEREIAYREQMERDLAEFGAP